MVICRFIGFSILFRNVNEFDDIFVFFVSAVLFCIFPECVLYLQLDQATAEYVPSYTNVNSRQGKMKEMSEVLAFLNKGIAAMDPVAPLLRQTPMLSMEYLFAIDVLSMLSMCYLCYLWNIFAIYGISMLSIKYYINSILTHRCAIYGISMLSMEYL